MGHCLTCFRGLRQEIKDRTYTTGEALHSAQTELEKDKEVTNKMMMRLTILSQEIISLQKQKKNNFSISNKLTEVKQLMKVLQTRKAQLSKFERQVTAYTKAEVARSVNNKIAVTAERLTHAGLTIATLEKSMARGDMAMDNADELNVRVDEDTDQTDELDEEKVNAFLQSNELSESDLRLLTALASPMGNGSAGVLAQQPVMVLGGGGGGDTSTITGMTTISIPEPSIPTMTLSQQQPQTDDDSTAETVQLLPIANLLSTTRSATTTDNPPSSQNNNTEPSSLASTFLQSSSSFSTINRSMVLDVVS